MKTLVSKKISETTSVRLAIEQNNVTTEQNSNQNSAVDSINIINEYKNALQENEKASEKEARKNEMAAEHYRILSTLQKTITDLNGKGEIKPTREIFPIPSTEYKKYLRTNNSIEDNITQNNEVNTDLITTNDGVICSLMPIFVCDSVIQPGAEGLKGLNISALNFVPDYGPQSIHSKPHQNGDLDVVDSFPLATFTNKNLNIPVTFNQNFPLESFVEIFNNNLKYNFIKSFVPQALDVKIFKLCEIPTSDIIRSNKNLSFVQRADVENLDVENLDVENLTDSKNNNDSSETDIGSLVEKYNNSNIPIYFGFVRLQDRILPLLIQPQNHILQERELGDEMVLLSERLEKTYRRMIKEGKESEAEIIEKIKEALSPEEKEIFEEYLENHKNCKKEQIEKYKQKEKEQENAYKNLKNSQNVNLSPKMEFRILDPAVFSTPLLEKQIEALIRGQFPECPYDISDNRKKAIPILWYLIKKESCDSPISDYLTKKILQIIPTMLLTPQENFNRLNCLSEQLVNKALPTSLVRDYVIEVDEDENTRMLIQTFETQLRTNVNKNGNPGVPPLSHSPTDNLPVENPASIIDFFAI